MPGEVSIFDVVLAKVRSWQFSLQMGFGNVG